jgi:mannose-6-phosphate isomerase-like protein (cupin superfamily)
MTIGTTMKTAYRDIPAFVTKDGSEIRELLHPAHHALRSMSIAEAIVAPGERTLLHRHRVTEEVYHITAGQGCMRLGSETFDVAAGDTIAISPGTAHNITCTGDAPLKILCASHPAYSDADTDLL